MVFGKNILISRSDILGFISDAILFGAVSSFTRYGFSLTTLERLSGWCVLLTAFYFGDKLRQYIIKKVHNADTGLDTQPVIPQKFISDNNNIYTPLSRPSNNGYIGPNSHGANEPGFCDDRI